MAGRLTQLAVEALVGPAVTNARVTQIALETLGATVAPTINARLTQIAVEALASTIAPIPNARLTQIAVETLATYVPPPALTVPPVSSVTSGSSSTVSVAASGGTPPYTYTITSGPLPPGLSLNPSTGVISGTPTVPGSYPYTVTVTDSHGVTGSASGIITVYRAMPPPNPADVEFILRRVYLYMRPHERLPVRGG